MTTVKSHEIHPLLTALIWAAAVLGLAAGCSGNDTAQEGTPEQTNSSSEASADGSAPDDTTGDDGTESSEDSVNSVAAGGDNPASTPQLTLADEDVASTADEDAGFQFEDEQGNLVAVYGVATLPDSFDALTNDARAAFPFYGELADVDRTEITLVVIDVAMCAAGIDAEGSGTAEFFLHDSFDAAFSFDPVVNRGRLSQQPVVQPSFELPTTAACSRGWLPVLWTGDDDPAVARYVLTTRSSSSAEPERHVYQWDIDREIVDVEAFEPVDGLFAAGQTVTFNDGRLQDSTVTVDGWAELVGAASEIEGTRSVAVSLQVCPGSNPMPQFGLGVDGWNIVAPLQGQDLTAAAAPGDDAADQDLTGGDATDENADDDATDTCVDGWLSFAVPFGAVPTSFFASDTRDVTVGYAEWSLLSAAIPGPQ